jgi:predicted alpha/beta hydrolase
MAPSELVTGDGYRLAVNVYEPRGTHRGAAVIVPAMAVEQDFYAPFASWLAERGWSVLTLDLRGIGASSPKSLRGFEADILTWARLDCAAALALARSLAKGLPLIWIGHSLGGQILAMTPGNESVSAALTVASGVGYWRENAYPLRRYSWLLWYLIAPVASTLFGYFPGRRLKIVGDLPRGVMEQWARWCRHPEYAVGVEGESVRASYRHLDLPLLSLSFSDDEYMSERNVSVLHAFYENAECDMRRFSPADFGLARIGHFGFFREATGHTLWPVALDWMNQARFPG